MPLFVVAVADETLCLKVHGSLVKVNSTELAISEPTVTGLREEAMETFDNPLALEFRLVDNSLSHIFAK